MLPCEILIYVCLYIHTANVYTITQCKINIKVGGNTVKGKFLNKFCENVKYI